MGVIDEFCSRHGIDADAFKAVARNGWAPAVAYLCESGVDPATLPREELCEITEAVHDLRFGSEQEAATSDPAETPEPQASETQPEPRQTAEKPQQRPDPWASAIAAVNSSPADHRRA